MTPQLHRAWRAGRFANTSQLLQAARLSTQHEELDLAVVQFDHRWQAFKGPWFIMPGGY